MIVITITIIIATIIITTIIISYDHPPAGHHEAGSCAFPLRLPRQARATIPSASWPALTPTTRVASLTAFGLEMFVVRMALLALLLLTC